jgi:hypothetical protein
MRLLTMLLLPVALLMMGNVVAQDSVANLAGTVWLEPHSNRNREHFWRFQADGVLTSEAVNEPAVSGVRGTWMQSGAGLYAEFNSRSLEFRGTLNGDTISGSTTSRATLIEH